MGRLLPTATKAQRMNMRLFFGLCVLLVPAALVPPLVPFRLAAAALVPSAPALTNALSGSRVPQAAVVTSASTHKTVSPRRRSGYASSAASSASFCSRVPMVMRSLSRSPGLSNQRTRIPRPLSKR